MSHYATIYFIFREGGRQPRPTSLFGKCKYFLALNPLLDGELMVTFRNVLYDSARDWWDVAHLHTPGQIPLSFSVRDYRDDVAERVRVTGYRKENTHDRERKKKNELLSWRIKGSHCEH